MPKRVTINDVALAAGVSRQTVTRAMNDMGDINEATKARILQVSADLGYRPSRFARSFVVRQKTWAIGLVVASFRNPYYTETAGEMLELATSRGYQVIIASGESQGGLDALRMLADQVDVVVGHFDEEEADIRAAAKGAPVVLLERVTSLAGVHSVELDLSVGIAAAVAALKAKGVEHLGMIDSTYSTRGGGPYVPSPRRVFFESIAGDDLAGAVEAEEESLAGGGRAFSALLRRRPDLQGVLVFNDVMAIGAVQASHVLGIDVPGQVRIMGIDGISLCEAVHPQLSTVSIDRTALAEKALEIVDDLVEAQFARVPSLHRRTTPTLVWRGSA